MFGAPPVELIEFVEQVDDFDLWPENAEYIDLFVRLQTQWRVGPAGATGLDYNGVEAAMRFMDRSMTPELFMYLQIMERAALDVMAETK